MDGCFPPFGIEFLLPALVYLMFDDVVVFALAPLWYITSVKVGAGRLVGCFLYMRVTCLHYCTPPPKLLVF